MNTTEIKHADVTIKNKIYKNTRYLQETFYLHLPRLKVKHEIFILTN